MAIKSKIPTSSIKSAMAPPILSLALPSEPGYVGNKSAVFPLQLLGYDVDPINSVQIPNFYGQVLNGQELWELIEGLEANDLLFYTHLLTGYIGSVSFLDTVLEVVSKLRSVNPNLKYVCDPVMGDEGKLYVPPELVAYTVRRILTEQDGLEACNIIHAAGPAKVVITSISIDGNLLLIGSHQKEMGQSPEQFKIVIPKIPAYFTGTGDLMTALLLGWSNKYPDSLDKAAELAVSSLQALLLRTLNDYKMAGYNPQSSSLEIRLIQSQDDIRHPQVKYKAHRYNQTDAITYLKEKQGCLYRNNIGSHRIE
ncbi:Pyridoxal kinase [Bertholletia excelsa]